MRAWKKSKIKALAHRHDRVRAKIKGDAEKPRLSVNRSLREIFVQLIDDEKGKTIVGLSSRGLKIAKDNPLKGKQASAYEAGLALAKAAREKSIENVCFDRGGRLYHGRVKAVAEGARAGGLKF